MKGVLFGVERMLLTHDVCYTFRAVKNLYVTVWTVYVQ